MAWDGDISAMGELARRAEDLAQIPARASQRVADSLRAAVQDEFYDGADPYGTAWEPLAESTIDKGRTPPPLTDTGAMRGSLNSYARASGGSLSGGVAITIDHPAAPHQTGWSGPQGEGPARPIFPTREMPHKWEQIIGAAVAAEIQEASR